MSLAQEINLPEKVGVSVLLTMILGTIIVFLVLLLWRSIKEYVSSKLDPSKARQQEAEEKSGVHTLGDQIYDMGRDVGQVKDHLLQIHEDIRDLTADNAEEHRETRQAMSEIHTRLTKHERILDQHEERIQDIERHTPLGES